MKNNSYSEQVLSTLSGIEECLKQQSVPVSRLDFQFTYMLKTMRTLQTRILPLLHKLNILCFYFTSSPPWSSFSPYL